MPNLKLLVALATSILISLPVVQADDKIIILSCVTRQANRADDRQKTIDKIIIDVANTKIDLLSSSIEDRWTFENRGYNKAIDWFDGIVINQFDDGVILAGGVRAKAVFGFNYNPPNGQLTYTFTFDGTPGYIIFDCLRRGQ